MFSIHSFAFFVGIFSNIFEVFTLSLLSFLDVFSLKFDFFLIRIEDKEVLLGYKYGKASK